MNKRRRLRGTWRPSPAMVVAVLALIVGLGGTAIAATLTKSDVNRIVKKQINKNAVKAKGASSANLADGDGNKLVARVRANQRGSLHIVGSLTAFASSSDEFNCRLMLNGDELPGSVRGVDLDVGEADREVCATNIVVKVGRGRQNVALNVSGADGATSLDDAALNVLFVP